MYGRLVNMMEVYLAETVIPEFKDGKIDVYYKILKQFGSEEIQNAHASATFWTSVLTNKNLS